jgi:hypothetical protein
MDVLPIRDLARLRLADGGPSNGGTNINVHGAGNVIDVHTNASPNSNVNGSSGSGTRPWPRNGIVGAQSGGYTGGPSVYSFTYLGAMLLANHDRIGKDIEEWQFWPHAMSMGSLTGRTFTSVSVVTSGWAGEDNED